MDKRAIALEIGSEGGQVGRDPRKMSSAELQSIGHQPMSPIEALRLKCLDCCAGSAHEVRLCVAVACPNWPFRMGHSPFRAKKILSDEQKDALRVRLATARERRR